MNINRILSDSSLWKILKCIKQRHALAGLDDTTCAGVKGFSTLLNCVEALAIEISIMKQIELQLEKGKRYLKTSYGLHCSNNTTVASHCISCVCVISP